MNNEYSYELLAQALGMCGRWEEAASVLGGFYEKSPVRRTAGWYAFALHQSGREAEAYEVALGAENMTPETDDGIVAGCYALANYWAARRDIERALDYVRCLCEAGYISIFPALKRRFPTLYSDPRYEQFIEDYQVEK